jgi:hypothetical protein
MRESARSFRSGRALAALALVVAAASSGGAGCSLLLDTDASLPTCNSDADCARFPNAACDSARRICVPRLPSAIGDGGAGSDTAGPLTCELSFDNQARIALPGPDGGLRPLPEAP